VQTATARQHLDILKSNYKLSITYELTSLQTGEEFSSISKILIENQFYVTLRLVSPTTLFKENHNQ